MSNRIKKSDIIKALELSGGMIYRAAKTLGCAPNTIYERAKKDKAIQATIDNQRGITLDMAETALKFCVHDKQPWAVCFTLKTLGKDRGYTERTESNSNITITKLDKVVEAIERADEC